MSTGWIVLGVIVIIVLFAFGAYNRLVALQPARQSVVCRYRRAAQAAPRSDPEPRRDREGLRQPRARHARRRRQGAQFRDVGAGPGAGRCRRKPAERRARAADRAVGGLSGPQGQRQFPAACRRTLRSRKQDRGRRRFFNNAVQEYNTGIQQLPAALFAGMFGFTRKEFFDLGASRDARSRPCRREVLTRNPNYARQSRTPWPLTVSTRTSHRTSFVRCCCSPGCFC